jgi:hypothetical protein
VVGKGVRGGERKKRAGSRRFCCYLPHPPVRLCDCFVSFRSWWVCAVCHVLVWLISWSLQPVVSGRLVVVPPCRGDWEWEGEVRPGECGWLIPHSHDCGGVKPSKFYCNLRLHDGAKRKWGHRQWNLGMA